MFRIILKAFCSREPRSGHHWSGHVGEIREIDGLWRHKGCTFHKCMWTHPVTIATEKCNCACTTLTVYFLFTLRVNYVIQMHQHYLKQSITPGNYLTPCMWKWLFFSKLREVSLKLCQPILNLYV